MQGFGNQPVRDINELIKKIEQEIAAITKNTDRNIVVLNNKLIQCYKDLEILKAKFTELSEYATEEYSRISQKVIELEVQLDTIKDDLTVLATVTVSGEKCVSGIMKKSEYEAGLPMNPLYAKYAEKDSDGNVIKDSYMKIGDTVSSTSAMYLDENKKKLAQIQAITGMMSVSGHQLILGF